MPSLSANGIDLYYEVHGQGTPILGIHGTPGSALVWVAAAKKLGDLGKCVVYDRRGFGRSEHRWPLETVDLADHVDDAAALLDALAATPAIVVGRSTGGLIALELAHRFPDKVRALVLLEPAVVALDPAAVAWAAGLRRSVLSAAAVDPGSAAEAVVAAALGKETWDSLPAGLREVLADTSPAVLAEASGRGLDLSAEPLELGAQELASIGQPTLLISAESSPEPLHRVNDRLAHALPKSESVLVAGGHLIDPAHPSVLGFVSFHAARGVHP